MKLVRFGAKQRERPGLVDADGHIRDLSDHVPDLRDEILSRERLRRLASLDEGSLPRVEGSPRLGPPVAGIGKILGIGRNYRSHAGEMGATPGEEPMVFSKAITALTGPFDPIVLPKHGDKTDWEVELAVIIGTRARYVDEAQALDHVAGYACINDISERAFQKERGGQFIKGKSADSFAPIGPWLVTADEIADPQTLELWCDVNGERKQSGNTRDMIFSVAFLISHLSQFMTLAPGDVIATGTPAGVGVARNPPEFLQPADLLECGIEGLGRQRHTVVAFAEAS